MITQIWRTIQLVTVEATWPDTRTWRRDSLVTLHFSVDNKVNVRGSAVGLMNNGLVSALAVEAMDVPTVATRFALIGSIAVLFQVRDDRRIPLIRGGIVFRGALLGKIRPRRGRWIKLLTNILLQSFSLG